MSISSEIRRAGPFAGNGSTVNFPFTFKVFNTSQVVVTRTVSGVETVLTLTTDYTISLNSNQDTTPGGTVTMLTAPATGQSITITSNVLNLQPTVLTNLGGFYPEVINDSLDRATIQIQQLDERLDRALVVPVSSSGVNTQLPAPEAGKILGWNSSANGVVSYTATTVLPPNAAAIDALPYSAGDYIEATGSATFRARKLTAATYAALTAIPAASRHDDMLVYVASRATDGDGGEGWWRFDAASSATANGYDVLAPDAGTGRWLSIAIYSKLIRTKAAIKALDPAVVKSATLASDNPLENGTYFWRTGNFTALVAADTYGAYYLKADSVAASIGAYVLEHQANVYDLNRFGADPTGTTDSLAAYNIAAALVTASGTLGQIEFSGSYRNSAELVVTSNIIISAKARSTLSPIGAGADGFRFQEGPGVYIGHHVLPALVSVTGIAINLDGCSLASIYCPQILAGNGIAVQLGALSGRNCLDNTVRVDTVAQMAEWVRCETTAGEIIQGNVVTSNFVVSTTRGVRFFSAGVTQPNWDSNRFEMEAWDPTPTIASSALLYARNTTNTHSVARTILKVHSWCGGLGVTSKIVDADDLNGVDLYIGPAETFPAGYYDVSNGINNTTNVRNNASRVDTVFAAALTAVGKATWNGGVPMTRNIENFSVTLAADLPDGNGIFAYLYHNLSDSYSNVVSVSQGYGTNNGLVCESVEGRGWVGASNDKEILMEFKNRSGATLTTGTVCQFKIKVGLP